MIEKKIHQIYPFSLQDLQWLKVQSSVAFSQQYEPGIHKYVELFGKGAIAAKTGRTSAQSFILYNFHYENEWKEKRYCEIYSYFTQLDSVFQGRCMSMLNYVIEEASKLLENNDEYSKIKYIKIVHPASLDYSLSLLTKLGFKEHQTHQKYYKNKYTALEMRLTLISEDK